MDKFWKKMKSRLIHYDTKQSVYTLFQVLD